MPSHDDGLNDTGATDGPSGLPNVGNDPGRNLPLVLPIFIPDSCVPLNHGLL